MSDKQTDIFSVDQSPSPELANFAELCSALYERELHSLAHSSIGQPSLLKRRLAGLPYHVKNIAHYLCQHNSPLNVDVHNASFQFKQAVKVPTRTANADKNYAWYSQHATPGLVVPIYIEDIDGHHIELDCVDRVDKETKTLHTNKFGWFDFYGKPTEQTRGILVKQLNKPSKAIMQSACCGHVWNHKNRVLPRVLSLRELLLSSQIDWKRFTLLKKSG